MANVYAVDFETYYDDDCTVKTLGPRAYTQHPSFDAYLVTVAGPDWVWSGHPADFDWGKLRGQVVVSHNATFDKTVYDSLHQRDPRTYPVNSSEFAEWNCTANLSAFLCFRRSLAQVVEHLYPGEIVSKSVRDWMKGKTWADIAAAGKAEDVTRYAELDSIRCRKLWLDFAGWWPAVERRLSLLTIASTQLGVAIDTALLEHYRDVCARAKQQVEKMLPWMARSADAKPTSPKEIALQCRVDGLPLPPLKSDDEEGHEAWLNEHAEKHPWVKCLGEWRQVNKVLTTLETIRLRLTPESVWDGTEYRDCYTIDTPLKYYGAHTGRWSGDSGLNFQNFRREPLVVDGEKIDVRRLIIARPGYKFVVADYAQIEPRCLAWLCDDHDFLQMVRDGWSVYEAHARASMGWTGEHLKKTDPQLYLLAKASRLGLGYGCGAAKFQKVAQKLTGLALTSEQAREAVKNFRDNNPGVVALWHELHTELDKWVGDTKVIQLPSGRTLQYPNILRDTLETIVLKRDKTVRKNSDGTPMVSVKLSYTADIGGVRKHFYGGKMCENLVQATARDVFAEGMLRLWDAGILVPMHVHDEVIAEVPADFPKEEVEKLLTVCPKWIPGLPVEVEAKETERYFK